MYHISHQKCIPFFNCYIYPEPTNLSLLSNYCYADNHWVVDSNNFHWKKKKAQLKSISEADCSKSNPKGDHWKMWNWYNSDTEDWQVCISAETKLWHIQVLQLPGVLAKMVKMSNYEKGRISDQKLSVKLDIIPPCPPWIYSSIALCKLYF